MKNRLLALGLSALLMASMSLAVFADYTTSNAPDEKIVMAEQTVDIRVMKGYGEVSLDIRKAVAGSYFTAPEFSGKTIDGHTFRGWDILANMNPENKPVFVKVGDQFIVNRDIVLWASWEKNVTFDAQGGTPVATQTRVINQSFSKLPVTSKPGFIFDGWYTENGQKVTESSWVNPLPAKETLYAHYKPVTNENTWALNTRYAVGDKVTFEGKTWTCTFAHTAYAPNWYPGAPGIWFWK